MKRPTQVDVARRAGVSRATVSYALNGRTNGQVPISDETLQRVLEAVKELGYEPDARAQALRSGSTKTIGLIIPDIHNPHFWQNADGVEQEARAAGYHLLLSSMDLSPEYGGDIFKDLAGRRIDGLILMGTFINQAAEAQNTLAHLKRRLPLVEISDRLNGNYDMDVVASDYREATKEAIAHLLSLQHRRIGLICGVSARELAEDRLQPYQDSLRAAGLPIEPELIIECGPTLEEGYQAALRLLQLPVRPTAVIAINDLLSIGVLRAAGDLHLRVPADLSLVSYDDIPMANYLVPRLTTATKDVLRLGREALKMLLARIAEPDRPPQRDYFPARLIVRESTGPAPL